MLDVTPYEGKTFPLGAMDSLVTQIRQLSLPLPVALWAKSAEDGLYYPSECLPAEAVHLIATILITNRAAVLDEVCASSFLQVLEQTAAQHDVDVRTSCDMKTAIATAAQISRFVHYYDKILEVTIVPAPREGGLTLDEVTKVAEGAGFVSASGRWELRLDEGSKEPVMALSGLRGRTRPSCALPLTFRSPTCCAATSSASSSSPTTSPAISAASGSTARANASRLRAGLSFSRKLSIRTRR